MASTRFWCDLATYHLRRWVPRLVCYGSGWWCHKDWRMHRLISIAGCHRIWDHFGTSRPIASMTSLSTVSLRLTSAMFKFIFGTWNRCFKSCKTSSCMPTSKSVSFMHRKFRCWIVTWVNRESKLIWIRCSRSVLGLGLRTLQNYDSGSVWQIICIKIQRIMLDPYSLCLYF